MGNQARVDTMVVEGGLCFDLRLPPGALPGIQQLAGPVSWPILKEWCLFESGPVRLEDTRPCAEGVPNIPRALATACRLM
jgi:hypothetical protein